MQRQLQLRIEAQGKYLKKIIEEQQRLSGVLTETPGSDVPAPLVRGTDSCPEPENKTDPATPPPTSETPLQDRAGKEHVSAGSLSIDDSLPSQKNEPLTPDSGCPVGTLSDSPKGDGSLKKLQVTNGAMYSNPEMVLTHQILESSSSYQHSNPVFFTREPFDTEKGISNGNRDQSEKVSGS